MKPRSRLLTVALAACLAVVMVAAPAAAAKQELSPRIKVQGAKLPAADETLGTTDDPAIGRTPPTLVGEGFNGKRVTIEHNAGTPRILIFLSHSCPHCQAEVPLLVKLAKNGKLDGVEVGTITTNTSENLPNYPPSKWLKREHWPFKPVLADDARLRAFEAFGGNAFPYFVFVAADGTVAARVSAELSAKTIAEVTQRLVAGETLFVE